MEKLLFDYLARYMVLTADEKKAIIDLDILRNIQGALCFLRRGK